MKKFALALGLAGMLLLSGCGGGGGTSGSTPVQPAPEPEPGETLPITDQGNYQLLPGYTYPAEKGDVLQMHVLQAGNVLFVGNTCSLYVFDSNYNEYDLDHGEKSHTRNYTYSSKSEYFEPGWYYLNVSSSCGDISVQSNVL